MPCADHTDNRSEDASELPDREYMYLIVSLTWQFGLPDVSIRPLASDVNVALNNISLAKHQQSLTPYNKADIPDLQMIRHKLEKTEKLFIKT